MSSHSFHGLEDVYLTVLNHLLDASIGSAINSGTSMAVTERNRQTDYHYDKNSFGMASGQITS